MQKLNDGGLDLASLRILQSLFETRNTTRTAEHLNISQPAVSRALSKLRAALGDQIMVRGSAGMVLTDRALEIQSRLAMAIARFEEFLLRPVFDPRNSERTFRITTTDYGAIAILPKLVAALGAKAPNIACEVLPFSSDAFRQLAEGQTDLVFYSDDEVPLPLKSRKLYRENYSCLVRRDHPVLKQKMDIDSFVSMKHALVSILGGRTGVVDDAFLKLGKQRKISIWLPYFATAATIVAKTDLVLTVPTRVANELVQLGKLTRFEPPLKLIGFDYRMLWHDRSHEDAGHKWLRDLLTNIKL